jgi:hypothetical protein
MPKEIAMGFRSLGSRFAPGHDSHVTIASRVRGSSLARFLALALLCEGLTTMACSSESGSDSPDERACQGDVGVDCPATFDDVLTATWTCQSSEIIWAGECMTGGPFTLNRNWGVYQTNCFYDPTSRQWVGANVVNDTPVYCSGTSASMSQGTVPVPYPHYCVGSSSTTQRSMACASSQP